MKKLSLLLLSIFSLIGLSSCNDSDSDYPGYAYFVTVKAASESAYYFMMDDDKTIYPGNVSRIPNYKPVDNQRAILLFNLLNEPMTGFNYNAEIFDVQPIYSRDAEVMPQEDIDQLANDGIEVYRGMYTPHYLTIPVTYSTTKTVKHEFYLVAAEEEVDSPEQSELFILELRHDAKGDQGGWPTEEYISFKIDNLKTLMDDKAGIKLVSKSLSGSEQSQQIYFQR